MSTATTRAQRSKQTIAQLNEQVNKSKKQAIVDIIEFATSREFCGKRLFLEQKLILKIIFNLPLDEQENRILDYWIEMEFVPADIRERMDSNISHFAEVILVIGRRGSKCAWEEDTILLSSGKRARIGDLLGTQQEIFSLDLESWKIVPSIAKFEDNGKKECLRITLASGKDITVTKNHPLLKIEGWEEARNLKVGDRIACPREYHLDLEDKVSDIEAKLLGYLVGDGGTTQNITFTNADEEILKEFIDLVGRFDESLKVVDANDKNCGKATTLRVSKKKRNSYVCNELRNFVKENGIDCIANNKRVPERIFQSSNERVSDFLNRYFACDGWIAENRKILCCSSSKGLISDIKHLLLRFGIQSRIRYMPVKYNGEVRDAWRLAIYGKDDVLRFIEKIGIFGEKNRKLKDMRTEKEKMPNRSRYDTIPRAVWEIFEEKGHKLRGDNRGGNFRKQYSPNRKKLLEFAEERNEKEAENLALSDIFWDEIISIDGVGVLPTVAIEVPKYHNYISNDVVNHNTFLASIIAAYYVYKLILMDNPQLHYDIDESKEIYIYCLARSEPQTKMTIFADIKNTILGCPWLYPYIVPRDGIGMQEIKIQTPNDKRREQKLLAEGIVPTSPIASVRIRSLHSNSATLRGPAVICCIYTEFAHFIDTSGRMSGEAVYEAVDPSIKTFGKDGISILESTPWSQTGKFFERFKASYGVSVDGMQLEKWSYRDLVSFHMPSWEMYKFANLINRRPIITFDDVKDKAATNPDTFWVEWGAEFARVMDAYFDPLLVDAIFDPRIKLSEIGTHQFIYKFHCDPGLSGANLALMGAHVEKIENSIWKHEFDQSYWNRGIVVVDYIKAYKPQDFPDGRVDYIKVEQDITELGTKFRTDEISFDQWNSVSSIQHIRAGLQKKGRNVNVHEIHFTRPMNFARFENLKTTMMQKRIKVPWGPENSDSHLLSLELKFLQKKQNQVVDKQTAGPVQTKDLADCLGQVVWNLLGDIRNAEEFPRLQSGMQTEMPTQFQGGSSFDQLYRERGFG